MDARQRFYEHNRLLQRFLIGATVVFVGIVMLLWWQEQRRPDHAEMPMATLKHFSAEATMADVTRTYVYGARIIHDLEADPEIRQEFFSESLREELGEATLQERLAEVAAARTALLPYSRDHVYHTSYYTGNLIVLPGLSLHKLLTEQPAPKTALLLETALADIRAGAMKIALHYDVAPPSWYQASSSAHLFYPAPSFPSLTMSETAMVLYLLATVDPNHARYYEQAAESFASQVFSTGAHFRLDVEYAIKLAAAYHALMLRTPEYGDLLTAAKAEWATAPVTVREGTFLPLATRFSLPGFPVSSEFALSVMNYATSTVTEDLRGSLRLSLIDTRLPKPALRLYEYELTGSNTMLPSALDLTPKQFPGLMSSTGYADYLESDRYVFRSGEIREREEGTYELASSSLFWRDGTAPVLIPSLGQATGRGVVHRSGLFALTTVITQTGAEIWQFDLSGLKGGVRMASGDEPSYLNDTDMLYRSGDELFVKSLAGGSTMPIEGVSSTSRSTIIRYDQDNERLLVVTVDTESTYLVPESTVSLYRVTKEGEVYEAVPTQVVRFTDAVVSSVRLSPQASFLAVALSEGLAGHRPRVLLFDINNGIIKEEIDLSSFAIDPLEIDGWTLF